MISLTIRRFWGVRIENDMHLVYGVRRRNKNRRLRRVLPDIVCYFFSRFVEKDEPAPQGRSWGRSKFSSGDAPFLPFSLPGSISGSLSLPGTCLVNRSHGGTHNLLKFIYSCFFVFVISFNAIGTITRYPRVEGVEWLAQ